MIELGYTVGKCDDYIFGGERREATVVIGPLRVIEELTAVGNRSYQIVVGCSRYLTCENGECSYSRVSREGRKSKEAELGT